MSLLDSLGLDDIPADPNDIPDGRYNGVVFKDEFVVKSDDTVHHVITYRVEDGQFAGAQKPEWFKVGVNPQRAETTNALTGFTPAMEETPKRWYKKRLAGDLGLTDEQIANYKPGDLTGTKVVFGIKTNGQWKNISFVEKREADSEAATQAVTGDI